MSLNTIAVAREPQAVFEVLAAPATYDHWVVGSAEIRDADAAFPAQGSQFHHTQGLRGLGIKDTTQVLDVDPGHRIVLEVRVRPVLTAEVAFHLDPEDSGTRVTMVERPLSGWLTRVPGPVLHAALSARNQLSLRRLKRVAERR